MLFDVFMYSVDSILPILLLMMVGYFISRKGPWDKEYFRKFNSMCFRVLFPVNLFNCVYAIEDLSALNWSAILYILAAITVSALIGVFVAKFFIADPMQKGPIIQVAFRSNQAVVGLSVIEGLGGDALATGFAGLTTALGVPLFNAYAVTALTVFGGKNDKKLTPLSLAKKILSNPLIIGAFAGLAVVIIEQVLLPRGADGLPVFSIRYTLPAVYSAIKKLAGATLPCALLVLGSQLDFGETKNIIKPLTIGVVLRLIVSPCITLGAAYLLRGPLCLTAAEFPSIMTISATPVAVASVVMTQEMGGDEQLAAQLVVWTSVLSMFTLCAYVFALRIVGLI